MALRLSHRVHFNSYHVHLDVSFSTVVESGALLSSNLEGRFRNSLFIMNESIGRGIYFILLYVFIFVEGTIQSTSIPMTVLLHRLHFLSQKFRHFGVPFLKVDH